MNQQDDIRNTALYYDVQNKNIPMNYDLVKYGVNVELGTIDVRLR